MGTQEVSVLREVVVRLQKFEERSPVQERLITLLATGLERLFEKERGVAGALDFGADESVTTTCPDDGVGEDRKT